MESRTTIQSFDWHALKLVQNLATNITTSYLTVNQPWLNNLQTGMEGASPWLNGFDMDHYDASAPRAIKAAGGDAWSSYHREVSAESIALAHELGLLVNVWTVNEPDRMRELLDMNVDGIITDYPNRLRQVLESSGLPVPLPTPVKY
ncbi:MAG: glycerophosphodiester phosphodiesterase, partial [Gammaproteobacteria bacterium]|nr:glycerophosphodiester phosphodiesterase [Gammaproteobacteria bacterium]